MKKNIKATIEPKLEINKEQDKILIKAINPEEEISDEEAIELLNDLIEKEKEIVETKKPVEAIKGCPKPIGRRKR